MLLGVAAMHVRQPVAYDVAAMRITNAPEADARLHRSYRDNWALPSLDGLR
ncbi:MAG: hypothetical protein AAGG50_14060 [Bacteroidota bacterium]